MVYDTFSKRQKAAQGGTQEVYIYDDIPIALRTQIVHIWYDALGDENDYFATSGTKVRVAYELIVTILRKERGVFILPPSTKRERIDYFNELINYFLHEKNVDYVVDIVQLSFQFIDAHVRDFHYQFRQNADEIADQAIDDLNVRFKENNIGYRYEEKQIIRIDSEFYHTEVVKPSLKLLNKTEYAGAQEEFLKAYDHYKNHRKKEVLNECLKAFESIMKSICAKRNWSYSSGANAADLIKVCLDNKLIPTFFQSKLESLKTLLVSGVPTMRNKRGAHGQGEEVVDAPDFIVTFALHETAAILIMFDQAETDLK